MDAKKGLWSALGALAGGALGAMAGKYAAEETNRSYSGIRGPTQRRDAAVMLGGAAGATLGAFLGGSLAPARGPVGVGALADEWGGVAPPALPSPSTSTEVRSPTSTSTEVRSPTSTSTEVRSPTNTSTEAYTADNFTATVTGGAGAGANTTVNIYPMYFNRASRGASGVAAFPSHEVQPPHNIRDMLHEVMSEPPPTGVMRGMMHEAMQWEPPKLPPR